MKFTQFCIIFLSFSMFAFGQDLGDLNKLPSKKIIANSVEEDGVRLTINKYFEGWINNDTLLVGQAMHETCHLKVIKEGKVVAYDRNQYLSFFRPGPAKEGCSGRIVSINMTGPIAAAKCELETPTKIYTDYFNMIKVDEVWVIVDKISTNIKK